ncbi:hypothetical protein [Paucibacter soli]|uniref:hypothetical protein n=1 Tax=Paucibacter soli TaxID=3133433 RepID=UPI0030A62A9B
MKVSQVDNYRSIALRQSMSELHANPRKLPEGFYSATVEPEFGMLVEPVNADPYIFLAQSTAIVFESVRHSGTDFLRQRMLAGVHLNSLVEEHRRQLAATKLAELVQAPATAQKRVAHP